MILDKLAKFKVADIPIGMYVTLEAAGGIAGFIANIMSGLIGADPRTAALIIGGAGTVIPVKVAAVRNMLGPEIGADLVSAEFLRDLARGVLNFDLEQTLADLGNSLTPAPTPTPITAAGTYYPDYTPEYDAQVTYGDANYTERQTAPLTIAETIEAARAAQFEIARRAA